MANIEVGVIAAAGKGTRAYPRTTYIPKPLFEFQGKTILERNVELMRNTFRVGKIYVLVGHLKEMVLSEIEKNSEKSSGYRDPTFPLDHQGSRKRYRKFGIADSFSFYHDPRRRILLLPGS